MPTVYIPDIPDEVVDAAAARAAREKRSLAEAARQLLTDYAADHNAAGGRARAAKMTDAQRRESARNAAVAMWAKRRASAR